MEVLGGTLAAGIIIFGLIVLLFVLAAYTLEIIGKWKLLKKAGKKGWEAIIPYYNTWTLVEISECKWWFFLIIICSSMLSINFSYNLNEITQVSFDALDFIGSIVNIVAILCVNYNLSKKCNKDMGFAIGLTILPFIFYPILGFGDSKFDNSIKVSPYGVIKEGEK